MLDFNPIFVLILIKEIIYSTRHKHIYKKSKNLKKKMKVLKMDDDGLAFNFEHIKATHSYY